jgi:hypothetical protein
MQQQLAPTAAAAAAVAAEQIFGTQMLLAHT